MKRQRSHRRGIAAVELAVLLPFLAVLLVLAVDWSRIFYCSVTIENCARNGAMYVSDPYSAVLSPYATMIDAALADAPNLSPQPTVSSATGTDSDNHAYVECTVKYDFKTLTRLPLIPQTSTVTRTVRVYQAQQIPQ